MLRDGSVASQRRIDPGGMREKKVRVKEALNLREGDLGMLLGSQCFGRRPLENPEWSFHLLVEETPMNGLTKQNNSFTSMKSIERRG